VIQLKDPSLPKQNADYVNGEWIPSASGKTVEVHDPATGQFIRTSPDCNKLDIERAVKVAAVTFADFRRTTGREREVL
jgi:acyl-CoA reductase-like NAD-dependent aldehyde dehydrogenase